MEEESPKTYLSLSDGAARREDVEERHLDGTFARLAILAILAILGLARHLVCVN
jgi:hypothetical protein